MVYPLFRFIVSIFLSLSFFHPLSVSLSPSIFLVFLFRYLVYTFCYIYYTSIWCIFAITIDIANDGVFTLLIFYTYFNGLCRCVVGSIPNATHGTILQ